MRIRWYELSADVCMVISKIELADEYDRTRYAKKILKELKSAGYKPNKQIYLDRIRNYEMKRWYDKNKFLFLAFEYLKDSEHEIQKSVVRNVLQFMNQEKLFL